MSGLSMEKMNRIFISVALYGIRMRGGASDSPASSDWPACPSLVPVGRIGLSAA